MWAAEQEAGQREYAETVVKRNTHAEAAMFADRAAEAASLGASAKTGEMIQQERMQAQQGWPLQQSHPQMQHLPQTVPMQQQYQQQRQQQQQQYQHAMAQAEGAHAAAVTDTVGPRTSILPPYSASLLEAKKAIIAGKSPCEAGKIGAVAACTTAHTSTVERKTPAMHAEPARTDSFFSYSGLAKAIICFEARQRQCVPEDAADDEEYWQDERGYWCSEYGW